MPSLPSNRGTQHFRLPCCRSDLCLVCKPSRDFLDCIDKISPPKMIRLRGNHKPWITLALRKLILKRDYLKPAYFKLFKTNKNSTMLKILWDKFLYFLYNSTYNQRHQNFYISIFRAKTLKHRALIYKIKSKKKFNSFLKTKAFEGHYKRS